MEAGIILTTISIKAVELEKCKITESYSYNDNIQYNGKILGPSVRNNMARTNIYGYSTVEQSRPFQTNNHVLITCVECTLCIYAFPAAFSEI